MKNTMKTIAKNEVFEALAHYLTLRHAYTNEDEALIDCYTKFLRLLRRVLRK